MRYVLDSNVGVKWVLEGCELLTADDRLIRSMQPAFPFITSLVSLP
jgi:hypothetical protein